MDLKYVPPTRDPTECSWLRRNFLNCLRDKAAKDKVPYMTCDVEKISWFNLECPEDFAQFNDAKQLRKIFIEQKNIQNGPKKPKWIHL